MTKEEIGKAIIDIIEDIVPDEDFSNIEPSTPLRDQLELDSMDFLDIVMELRKLYKVDVPEADYGELATLESCMNYLEPKMKDL